MLFRKLMSVLLSAVFLISTLGTASASAPETVQDRLAAVETDTYGGEQTGAIIDRINHLEKDYEGTHRTGSMMERVDALYNHLYDNASGPSIMAQLNAVEWSIEHQVSMKPVQQRITEMETTIQGKTGEGTYRQRIAKLSSYAFGSNTLPLTQVSVPANTLIKISLVTPVNAKNLKVGDTIQYKVAEDVVENGMLLFAKGEPGTGTVTKVKQARNFGRDAEVVIDFKSTKAMDGTNVDTFVGAEAKKQMETLAMAAGASLAGIVLLGPIGVVAGIFVNGKNIDLPAGTELYIQTKADTTLYGVPMTSK